MTCTIQILAYSKHNRKYKCVGVILYKHVAVGLFAAHRVVLSSSGEGRLVSDAQRLCVHASGLAAVRGVL